ncbi:MAG: lamin tail domain-containing protein, partial [Thermoplasmata archaeon]|nr:lamin tail domain-containing protein [Thermoplasmata archaeon]
MVDGMVEGMEDVLADDVSGVYVKRQSKPGRTYGREMIQDRGARSLLASVFLAFLMVSSSLFVVNIVMEKGFDHPLVEEAKADIADHVVISEVMYDNDGTDAYEFIELYNPTSSDIDISNWVIEEWEGGSDVASPDRTMTIPAGQIIRSHGFYLIAQFGSSDGDPANAPDTAWGYIIQADLGPAGSGAKAELPGAWQTLENGPDAVCIKDAGGTYMDGLLYGNCSDNPNLASWPDNPEAPDVYEGSLERNSGDGVHNESEGNGWDSDDNSCDFHTRKFTTDGIKPNPQNSDNATETPPAPAPPEIKRVISTSSTTLEVRFTTEVNQTDVENITHWKIVALGGYDTTPPRIEQCVATDLTHVEITFSEPVNKTDAENTSNYAIDGGLSVISAVLDSELTTVNLTTSTQTEGQTYTLTVNNINDTASPPNTIAPNSQATFSGGGGGGTLTVVFMDIGQGDATLIISPSGQAMLVDSGPTGSGTHVLNVLSSYGVAHLKYTVATHYHEDHIGAMDEIINALGGYSTAITGYCYDRNGSYSSTAFDEYASATGGYWYNGGKRREIFKGDLLDLGGGVTVTCEGVNGNGLSVTNENDYGVVLKMSYGNFDMYVAGDLGGYNSNGYTDVESTVADDVGPVEVYQVDHHGSKYSSNSYFLGVLEPLVSVFSVGDGNSYGHVHQEAYDRIDAVGSYMYYTEYGTGALPQAGHGEVVNGDIVLTTDGSQFTVNGTNYMCKGLQDTEPPTVINVVATDLTHVEVTFSETVNQTDAENINNYFIDQGLGNSLEALLQGDLRTVNLTTATQTEGVTYNMTINNIKDRASPPNTIATDTVVQFTGGQPTLQVISASIDPNDAHIVYLTTGAQSRMGYRLYAYHINSTTNPPIYQNETSMEFVGGGPQMVISEVLYDASGVDADQEWWEIYNPEQNTIDIASWKFQDNANSFVLPADTTPIPTGSHAVFAMNGRAFYDTYGFYPDFEVFGDTPARDMSYSGYYHSTLGNTDDYLLLVNKNGGVYDAVAWDENRTVIDTYQNIIPFTGTFSGESVQRVNGAEGPEPPLSSSPTWANEGAEDETGSEFTSGTPTPTTLDSQPPAIVEVRWEVGSVYAVVYWNTTESGWPEINPESTTKVVYSTDPSMIYTTTVENTDMVTEHGIMISSLQPDTDYYFYISSTDGIGHTAMDDNGGAYYHIHTLSVDNSPPIISGVSTSVTDTTATITWTTDENSSSTVWYGTSTPPDNGASNLYLSTSHEVPLYGLLPGTTYYFYVTSTDPSGNRATDDNGGAYYTFTTLSSSPVGYYLADMDSFTSFSAGVDTPDNAYTYAKNTAGIDVLGINDYSYQLTSSNYSSGKTSASSNTVSGSFVALYGQQMWDGVEGYGQISTYYENPEEVASGGALVDLDSAFNWIKQHDAVAFFNIPGYQADFNGMQYNASVDDNMVGIQ